MTHRAFYLGFKVTVDKLVALNQVNLQLMQYYKYRFVYFLGFS